MSTRRVRRYARAAALVAFAASASGCSRGAKEVAAPSAAVERGRIERIVVATGTVEPEREVEVRPRTAGIVEKIRVEANDLVTPGQVLIELERELLEAQVREARAAVESARVELRYAGIEQGRVEQLRDRDAASASARSPRPRRGSPRSTCSSATRRCVRRSRVACSTSSSRRATRCRRSRR
ncbi:MAG: efflux transporter periplasmic adaptor subunit [Deltaproteobacteria bacterium]|nr:efflux transporter periplasmic adaptor subunit [Deltaproteobacteria bacterium]